MTQPTAAAMRAAWLFSAYAEHAQQSAGLIDNATGLPELIAACETMLDNSVDYLTARDAIRDALRIAREGRS